MFFFTRASVINYHTLGARTTEFSFSLCFGSQKSEIKVLARSVPSRDSEETVTCLSHIFWWLQTVLGIPASLHSVSIITWPPSLGVFTWPSYEEGHQLLELESTPNWYDLS